MNTNTVANNNLGACSFDVSTEISSNKRIGGIENGRDEELIKLFQAYANTKEGTALSLDEITQATGVPRTIVSKNNGFMVQVGLITEGNKKAATETGRALGRAYTSKITDEVERIWKEIIAEVDFLNRMLSAVRIRNGMDRSSFINHIIYSSGLKDAKESRAGAGALIEIFKSVGVLSEVDGKLSVLDEPSSARVSVASNTISAEQTHSEPVAQQALPVATISAKNSIVINININCTPADIDGLGEKISQLLYELSE